MAASPVTPRMLEFVQITAQYSNAVLTAILPFVSEFAAKMEFPVVTPLNLGMVQQFKPDPRKGEVGGLVTLTNGYRFWFERGHVNQMVSPWSYYDLQDPREIPRFFGPVRLTEAEALGIARKAITNLGYSLETLYAHVPPATTSPPKVGTNIVPRYRFEWRDPIELVTSVGVEVNGTSRRIERLTFASRKLWRDSPKLAIQPPSTSPTRAPKVVSTVQSNALLRVIAPQVSEWSKKLDLPIDLPVTSNSLSRVFIKDPDWDVRAYLTNGYVFFYAQGYVRGLRTQDPFFRRDREDPPVDEKLFLGEWKMSEKEAVVLARETVKKVAGEAEMALMKSEPTVLKPDKVGPYVVPRYWIQWLKSDPQHAGTDLEIGVEVDADKKIIKYLRVFNSRLWEKLPEFSTIKTNATNPWTKEELERVLPANPSRSPTNQIKSAPGIPPVGRLPQ